MHFVNKRTSAVVAIAANRTHERAFTTRRAKKKKEKNEINPHTSKILPRSRFVVDEVIGAKVSGQPVLYTIDRDGIRKPKRRTMVLLARFGAVRRPERAMLFRKTAAALRTRRVGALARVCTCSVTGSVPARHRYDCMWRTDRTTAVSALPATRARGGGNEPRCITGRSGGSDAREYQYR